MNSLTTESYRLSQIRSEMEELECGSGQLELLPHSVSLLPKNHLEHKGALHKVCLQMKD